MNYNITITGSSYTQSTGVIQLAIYDGISPYLIQYRNFDGSTFSGIKIDDHAYLGYPQYTQAINVPVGVYYVDITDHYGLGTKQTECVIVGYSGYTQYNINTIPSGDIITFPCDAQPNYWIQTENGCYINLGFNGCEIGCFLVTEYTTPEHLELENELRLKNNELDELKRELKLEPDPKKVKEIIIRINQLAEEIKKIIADLSALRIK